MPLGYCKGCDKLKQIVARERKYPNEPPTTPKGRQQNWYPVDHAGPDGGPCSGSSQPL